MIRVLSSRCKLSSSSLNAALSHIAMVLLWQDRLYLWKNNKPTAVMRVRAEHNSNYRKQEKEGKTFGVLYFNLSRLLRYEKPAILSEVTRSFHAIANSYFSVLTHNLGEGQPEVSGRTRRRKRAISQLWFFSPSYQIVTSQ